MMRFLKAVLAPQGNFKNKLGLTDFFETHQYTMILL